MNGVNHMNLYGVAVILFLSSSGTAQIDTARSSGYSQLVERGRAEYGGAHLATAEHFLRAALDRLEAGDQIQRADTLADLGNVYLSEEEVSKAEHAFLESLAIYKQLADVNNTVMAMRNLGFSYSLEGRQDDALGILQESLRLTRTIPDINAALLAGVLNGLGMTYYRKGNIKRAEQLFQQALQKISASGSALEAPELLSNLGAVYVSAHKFQMAEDVLKIALTARERQVGPMHPDLTLTLVALAVLYNDMRRYAEAEDQCLRALQTLDGKPEFDTRTARILLVLSVTYKKAGRKLDADVA